MAPTETTEGRRAVIAVIVGVAVAAVAAPFERWELTALVAWDVTAALVIGWVWLAVARLDASGTRRVALREDASRGTTRVLLTVASVASLIAVMFALVKASSLHGAPKAWMITAVVATVILSWALVHTLFTLRYAHLYYSDHPGGIDFKSADYQPRYVDFAYVAFTVGMTFQVSDTDIQLPAIRSAVLRQALLSYLFGTVIVASAINIVAGLLR